MNLSLFDVNPPTEPSFTRIVLHEFGHATGFHHEHQGSKDPCAENFDWPVIYVYLQGAPNYWPKDRIDRNLRPRPVSETMEESPFGVSSIMLYSFPKNSYKGGVDAACYTSGNFTLSATDKVVVKNFYPANAADAQAIRDAGLVEFNSRVDALEITDFEKSIAKVSAAHIVQQAGAPEIANWNYGLGSGPVAVSDWQDGIAAQVHRSGEFQLDYFDKFQVQSPRM